MNRDAMIHPSALVDEGAHVGEETKIWHFSHISAGAHIGARCSLGQNTYLAPSARVGDGCKIQNNVSLYDGVILEDDVFIGPSVVFTNVITPRAHISRRHEYAQTRVGRGASIGANATIICGVHIGAFAMIGAGAVVTRSVEPFAIVAGNPARPLGYACQCGARLPTPAPRTSCRRCPAEYTLIDDELYWTNERDMDPHATRTLEDLANASPHDDEIPDAPDTPQR